VADAIRVEGLAEFSRNLKRLDAELPKALRIALNDVADVVVGYARPRIPRRRGRARASLRVASTRTRVRVRAGGKRAPHYPWLDFGGRVGRNRSVTRPFLREGRYLYKGYFEKRADMALVLERALLRVAAESGIEVD
jgi:hypothetical protein